MFKKKSVFCVLMVGIVLLAGCGSKELPRFPFSPVGTWEVESIAGKPVSEYFALFGGNLGKIKTDITQNDFVFFENGSWFWTLGLAIESNMGGGVYLKAEMSLAGKGSYTGSYTPSGGSMIIIQEDLAIRLTPEDFWASAEVSESDFKAAITRNWLLGEVENWSARVTGPRLTLTNSDGVQQVLMRK